MTEKAKAVLNNLRKRQAQRRNRILEEFNQSTLDTASPLGSPDQQMRVLGEMNSLADDHDAFVKSLAP